MKLRGGQGGRGGVGEAGKSLLWGRGTCKGVRNKAAGATSRFMGPQTHVRDTCICVGCKCTCPCPPACVYWQAHTCGLLPSTTTCPLPPASPHLGCCAQPHARGVQRVGALGGRGRESRVHRAGCMGAGYIGAGLQPTPWCYHLWCTRTCELPPFTVRMTRGSWLRQALWAAHARCGTWHMPPVAYGTWHVARVTRHARSPPPAAAPRSWRTRTGTTRGMTTGSTWHAARVKGTHRHQQLHPAHGARGRARHVGCTTRSTWHAARVNGTHRHQQLHPAHGGVHAQALGCMTRGTLTRNTCHVSRGTHRHQQLHPAHGGVHTQALGCMTRGTLTRNTCHVSRGTHRHQQLHPAHRRVHAKVPHGAVHGGRGGGVCDVLGACSRARVGRKADRILLTSLRYFCQQILSCDDDAGACLVEGSGGRRRPGSLAGWRGGDKGGEGFEDGVSGPLARSVGCGCEL